MNEMNPVSLRCLVLCQAHGIFIDWLKLHIFDALLSVVGASPNPAHGIRQVSGFVDRL